MKKYDENGFQIVQAALTSLSGRHGFQVAAKDEQHPDYFQKLVDLGCKPDTLGTVTWNSVTRSVDVSGTVLLRDKGLTRLPFQFGKVGGDFWCYNNRLTSLEGAPKEVGGSFWCFSNRFTSLKGAPEKVGGDFNFDGDLFISSDGSPKEVGGNFYCSADDLTDVSALRQCKIKGVIYLGGLRPNQERVKELLRVQGYKGKIIKSRYM
jgi:hypothetical protein